ncbi:PD-(D/E)XK nuclease family protein [Nonomuraea sp. NPDC059023]|uniref:PD-(D/E)XK nuclease family protein n=1 Tax=unclassified Nonomuraea TaxID=2593643 RepID=UPI0036B1798F
MVMPTLAGDPGPVRLPASLLDRPATNCQDFTAVKARPRLRSVERPRYAPWDTFPLGLVMKVLDAVEFNQADPGKALDRALAGVHPGLAAWVRHACRTYLESFEELRCEQPRVVQGDGRVLTAWGRWYGSVDGSVVEFRRLRMRHPSGSADSPATVAAAFVAAAGDPVADPKRLYHDIPVPVELAAARPQRVRVVEVGLTTGVQKVLIDASPEEIRRQYDRVARPKAAALLAGGVRQPGADCSSCKIGPACSALPHTPGMLGLDDRGTHRRTWSVTTSRYYEICPAQAHLRELRLPAEWDTTSAVQRGRDVHRWLEQAHRRGVPCEPADLPVLAAEVMADEDYDAALPYLLQHLEVCPLRGPGVITEVRPEPVLTAYDSRADVVVLAHPDLLRRVDGRLVYREQKTSACPRGITEENVLAAVPQLALAVCLIAAGLFGTAEGLVELEQLHPHEAPPVIVLDAADPEVVATARRIVHERAVRWHRDVTFTATPGWWCDSCPVSRWCPQSDGQARPRGGEVVLGAAAGFLDDPGPETEDWS